MMFLENVSFLLDPTGTRELFYLNDQEIGSVLNGKIDEFRIIHPENPEITLAIELQNKTTFPIQDYRGNICALQQNNQMTQWNCYSAFGLKETFGNEILNPWNFANRRQIGHLYLFKHRFYDPNLMRWLTKDPAGHVDGLNPGD